MNVILHFLQPASGMDWFFFSLIWGTAAFAIFAGFRHYQVVKDSLKPERMTHLRSDLLDRNDFWGNISANAPGFVMILGLLGTFLGIGLAIQGAGAILATLNDNRDNVTDIQQTVGQLSPMLSEIGLKFRSSTWGILAHVLLRLILPLFDVTPLRRRYDLMVHEELLHSQRQLEAARWQQVIETLEKIETHLNRYQPSTPSTSLSQETKHEQSERSA